MRLDVNGTLALVGAGNMGGALLAGWLERGLSPSRIVIQDPAPPPAMQDLLQKHGIRPVSDLTQIAAPPAVLVLAVKPQIMDAVAAPLGRVAGRETVVLSVAAGRTIAGFELMFPSGTAIVRSIPNTPASVGRGITVAVANRHTSPAQKQICDSLLRAVGEVAWTDDEAEIDAVTAVSGSGPAYVFYLAECLAAAGIKAGLKPALAQQLARCTVAGAGELLHRSDLPAETLRRNVTSPNGTTFAALQVLMDAAGTGKGLEPLLTEAVLAATRRSRELAQ